MNLRRGVLRRAYLGYTIVYTFFMCACMANASKKMPKQTEFIVENETFATAYLSSPVENVVVTETPPMGPEFLEIDNKSTMYFDIPLSHDIQSYIFSLCADYGIDASLIISVIERESKYNAKAVGDNGNSLGLMQIQPRWCKERMRRLSCTDLLDPYQNVLIGIDILSEYLDRGKSIEWALMAYNGGPSYADRKISQGEISKYAEEILKHKEELYYD